MTINPFRPHWLVCAAGSLVLAGFAFLVTQDSPGQTGKAGKRSEERRVGKECRL